MQQQQQDKPAMIRIESKMQHGLRVPLPGPGKSVRGFVEIPAADGDKPGVVETDQLDAVTVNRLRYHYEWRPSDPKQYGKKRDELSSEQVIEIGLIKITILDEAPKPKQKNDQKAA